MLSGETAFELAPECPRCRGKGTIKLDTPGPRPEYTAPLSAAQQIRVALWRLGQGRCPECEGTGQVQRSSALSGSAR